MVDLKIKLPEGFLDEENRCGYTVTKHMKEVWAVELDLFAEFDRVCKKHNIRYCADGGTLLGAVRHKGFIPWDNDMDIAMLRSDFEKLNEVAPKEFRKPYFWQTEETDPGSARGHAQLRNSDTTGILFNEYRSKKNNNFNQGIFIDIFPFDTVIDDENSLKEQDKKRKNLKHKYNTVLDATIFFRCKPWTDNEGKKHFNLKKICRYFKYKLTKESYLNAYKQFTEEVIKYNNIDDTEFVADLCMAIPLRILKRYREDFFDLTEVEFEFMKIPIFTNYDRNLQMLYGKEYMVPKMAKCEHGELILDTEKPYTWYLAQRD